MPIQIGQRPAHGFDEPLRLLTDCHRRIEHFLNVLLVIEQQAADAPLLPGLRADLEQALTYFATAAPRHTADEDESLFPRLKAAAADTRILGLLTRLEREHELAARHHLAVESLGRHWLEAGRLGTAERAELRVHLHGLRDIYEQHIGLEDRELFPAAAEALSIAELQAVGREMAARRAVTAPPKA
jgi:hemerythrin-like domain-containing protein